MIPVPSTDPSGNSGVGADCNQLNRDLANTLQQLGELQTRLKNTPGPEGPGTPRDQIEKAIALLESEIAAIEATIEENGCNKFPGPGPKTQTFDSPVYGSITLAGAILAKWGDLFSQHTAAGENVASFLGSPVRPTQFISQPNRLLDVQEFERGVIINVEGAGKPFVVYGAIYARYHSLGDYNGFLGVPTDDERVSGPGRVATFEGGQIYLDPVAGDMHEVHGAILDRWLKLGGPQGPLSFPLTDELPVRQGAPEIGRFQLFRGGAIYWTAATGAFELLSPIYAFWKDLHGGVLGNLGFPTSGQTSTPAGTTFQTFQKGIVVVPKGGTPIAVTGGLQLQLFGYIVDASFNVQINIKASTGQENHGRMPADGEFPKGSQDFGPLTLLTIPSVAHGAAGTFVPPDLSISISMEAISQNVIGKDDRKGTITATYNIDNTWGLAEISHTHKDGAFTAEFEFQPTDTPAITDDANFRERAFWPFHNFDTNPLSWAQYEKTFRDVAETDKHINLNPLHLNVHLFEIAFYEAVYRSLAAPGNCFGMCCESLYARARRSLFLEPIFSTNSYVNDGYVKSGAPLDPSKPNSAEVGDEVNVKHGYQLGAEMINWFLGKWTAGALHDPVRAFRESRDASLSGDWPILTVSADHEFSTDGHVLVPYAWNGDKSPIQKGQTWEILCANANFPPGTTSDNNDDHCKVVVHPFEQQFEFHFGDDTSGKKVVWTGSNQSGGRLLSIPFSVLSSQPVTVGDEIFALLASGLIIVLADGGSTSQFSDSQGRTLFVNQPVPGPTGGTRVIRVVNPDPKTRIPNLMPVVFRESSPNNGTAPEIYYWQRDPGPLESRPSQSPRLALDHDIQGKYSYILRSKEMLVSIKATGGRRRSERISVQDFGEASQRIVLHGGGGVPDGGATPFQVRAAGWQANRGAPLWFEFDTNLNGGQQLHFQVGNAGTQFTVMSTGLDAHLNLGMFTRAVDPAADPISTKRGAVPIPAGQPIRLNPVSWLRSDLPSSKVNRAVLAAFGTGPVLDVTTI